MTLHSSWRPWILNHFKPSGLIVPFLFQFQQHNHSNNKKKNKNNKNNSFPSSTTETTNQDMIHDIKELAGCHETAASLITLIDKDGAGSWPPRANHEHSTWPVALRPYKDIYYEMAPLLPSANVSLDDDVNRERIIYFRSRFRKLLNERVDLGQVTLLLQAADAGRWDVFPRDTYNAFYCCIAWCRHAYR
jgi:hypothetical protein